MFKVKRLLYALMLLSMVMFFPVTAFAAAPYWNQYYTPPDGTATPASPSGVTPAVQYIFNEKTLSDGLFLNATKYRADFISPEDGADYGIVTFENNGVQYIPSAAAAGKTIKFKVYGGNEADEWSDGGIEFTVNVNIQPTEGSSNTNLLNLSYQAGDGAVIDVPDFQTDVLEYTVRLPVGTPLDVPFKLYGSAEDINAVISQTSDVTGYAKRSSTITVTAENGATTQTYTVFFSVEPPSVPAGIIIDGEYISDGAWLLVSTEETIEMVVTHGAGEAGYGSLKGQTDNFDLFHIGVGGWGVYPNIYFLVRVKAENEGTAVLTVDFYQEQTSKYEGLTPAETIHITLTTYRADYSRVDTAIMEADALNRDNYKDFSGVEAAVSAVDRDKSIGEQTEVDAMAEAIENAVAALVYKDADYTQLDAAIASARALNKDSY